MWPFVILTCLGALPLFGPTKDNAWDELRQAFYTRQFTTGEVYEHDAALDGPPYSTWARFWYDDEFHEQVAGKLDAFLKLGVDEIEQQPAVRRAILLRDLWAVFDAQFNMRQPFDGQNSKISNSIRSRKNSAGRGSRESCQNHAPSRAYGAGTQQLPDNLQAAAALRAPIV